MKRILLGCAVLGFTACGQLCTADPPDVLLFTLDGGVPDTGCRDTCIQLAFFADAGTGLGNPPISCAYGTDAGSFVSCTWEGESCPADSNAL
jgi:hypothetical protein